MALPAHKESAEGLVPGKLSQPQVAPAWEGRQGSVCRSKNPAQTPKGTFPNHWLHGPGGRAEGRLPGCPPGGFGSTPSLLAVRQSHDWFISSSTEPGRAETLGAQ